MTHRRGKCMFTHASYVDANGLERHVYFKDNGYPLNVFRASKRNLIEVEKEIQKEEPEPEPEPEPERIEVPVKAQKAVHRFHPCAYELLDGHAGF